MSPPTRRSGPRHESRSNVEKVTTDTDSGILRPTPDNRQELPADNVVAFPARLSTRRREELQAALDGVPIALGLAAGMASVMIPFAYGDEVARRSLQRLRRTWHEDVDRSIDFALADLGRAS